MPLAPAAIGIVLNENKTHILLVQRQDVPIWVLPGGGVENKESPSEAVKREVFEETGLMVAIERQCAEYSPINRLAVLTSVFLCRVEKGCLTPSEETPVIQFYPLNALPSNLFSLHKDWIKDALENPGLVKKDLTQVTYLAACRYFLQHPLYLLRYAWTRWIKSRQ